VSTQRGVTIAGRNCGTFVKRVRGASRSRAL